TSHHFCFFCDCWHVSHLGRTDYENWKALDDDLLRKAAEIWINSMLKNRKAIEQLYGTRYSELWRLPYWRLCQIGIDPMHVFFLILLQRYFRDILGLDNPDDPKKKLTKPRFKFAFQHEFTSPPPLSSLVKDVQVPSQRWSSIGSIHQILQQPLAPSELDELKKALKKLPGDSLAYVCIDIEQLPSGQISKDDMVRQLTAWRMTKPLNQINPTAVDSSGLLRRIQQVVREVVTPAWVSNPPRNVGLYEAGVLKADHWRTLFSIHVPLATLSLWRETSPLAAADACNMASVVDTTMNLCCASLVMTKRKLTLNRREQFRHLLRLHILGLQKNFPGWIFPSHHLAFHIHDFMDLFSGVRHWWLFPFENLIGKLQRIPTNHKPGEFEHTTLHFFNKGSNFRQFLLQPNAPPILQYAQRLIDKAY
ncbi:hypothetical protein EV368DRAFT_4048, partial [Lentinula lateritia]